MINNGVSAESWCEIPEDDISVIESLGRLAYGCLDLHSVYSSILSTIADKPRILLRSLFTQLKDDETVLNDLCVDATNALSSVLSTLDAAYGIDQPEEGVDEDELMEESNPECIDVVMEEAGIHAPTY